MLKDNNDEMMISDEIAQLREKVEELTVNYSHVVKVVERLEKNLLHEIKERENQQQKVQVISSSDKNKKIAEFTKENRSFIRSIWKR